MSTLKLRILTRFPALVSVSAPLLLVKSGLSYAFSIDVVSLTAQILATANTWAANQLFAGVFGYAPTAGGAVTQITSKATAVTLSKPCGAITLNNASLAAGTIVSFVLTNTNISANDVLILNHISGGTPGSYTLNARCAAGSATIDVRNNTAGALGEAIVIQFALIKSVIA